MFGTLIDKIYDILHANTLIQEVYKYEAEQFKGEPVAVISPSGNESDYTTVRHNERMYGFNIKLFVDRNSRSGNSSGEADRVLRELVDSVLDDFDKDYIFSGLSTPLGYTMINVFALPSQWGYAGAESEYRVAEVIIRCRVHVDVTKIS